MHDSISYPPNFATFIRKVKWGTKQYRRHKRQSANVLLINSNNDILNIIHFYGMLYDNICKKPKSLKQCLTATRPTSHN